MNNTSCRQTLRVLLVGMMFAFSGITALYAQSSADKTLERLQLHYSALDFKQVINLGDSLINSGIVLPPEDGIVLHEILALAAYNLGNFDLARGHFISVLSLNPRFQPDPGEVSPKIIRFFEEMKPAKTATVEEKPEEAKPFILPEGNYIRYIQAEDRRPTAAFRSLIVPGWGQFYKGHTKRGWILGTAFWGSLAGTAIAAIVENSAESDYVNAVTPADITSKYQRYDSWYKARRNLSLIAISVWLANVADANWSPYVETQTFGRDDLGVVSVGMRVRF